MELSLPGGAQVLPLCEPSQFCHLCQYPCSCKPLTPPQPSVIELESLRCGQCCSLFLQPLIFKHTSLTPSPPRKPSQAPHSVKDTALPGGPSSPSNGSTFLVVALCQRRHKRHRFEPWVRKIPWRRKWQPTPVFLPGESHGQRSLAGYRPWGHKESGQDSTAHITAWNAGPIQCRQAHSRS